MGFSLLRKWQLSQAINARRDLSPLAKVTAARLLDHLNSKTGACYPSFETLAKGVGASRRGVIIAIKQLERKRIVFVRRQSQAEALNGPDLKRFAFDWTMAWSTEPNIKSRKKKPACLKMPGVQSPHYP